MRLERIVVLWRRPLISLVRMRTSLRLLSHLLKRAETPYLLMKGIVMLFSIRSFGDRWPGKLGFRVLDLFATGSLHLAYAPP